jgi:type IV pilus assembly protein PilM
MASKRTSRRTLVGLDIEPGHVAAVEASANGAIAVQRAAVAALEPDVMRDGELQDAESLTATLRALFAENNLPKRVRLGVANAKIVVRTVELPLIADLKDFDAAIRFQAQEHIPMPLDQAVLDYQSIGNVETPDGERTRVVLVAARRDMIERLVAAARAAGLKPEGVDLSAFAMLRALDDGGPDPAPVLYVNISGMTNVVIADGGVCRFTRVVSGGLEAMVGQLAERRALTLEHSRQWLSLVGLTAPIDTIEGDAAIAAEARSVLADGVRKVADDIRSSVDFFHSQEASAPVERAVLTGPARNIPGFIEQLGGDLGMPVEGRAVREASPGAAGALDTGLLTVAAGLSVESRS